jgi:hypothetical protein
VGDLATGPGFVAARAAGLIAEQFFHLIAGGVFARVGFGLGHEPSPGKLEVFAKISHRFLKDRVGAAVAALVSGAEIIAHAIQAHAQIGAALMA